jgi:hypothetical protein
MRRALLVLVLALCPLLAGVLASGCTAAMPPDDNPEHLRIHWRKDFETAKADAEREQKPILMITAAGDITGFC